MRFGSLTVVSLLFFANTASAIDPISLVLEAPNSVRLIKEYLGLIESIESKVDRLLEADQKTAVHLFEQAKANPEKSANLIREARVCFTRAAAIQDGSDDESRRHKRAVALLGLWCCCKAEDDVPNATLALKKIIAISDKPSRKLEYDLGTPGLISLGRALASGNAKPSRTEMRRLNKDYDSLLAIQERVKEHMLKAKVKSSAN